MKAQHSILWIITMMVVLFSCGPQEDSASDMNKPLTDIEKGARIFKKYCVACHGLNGKMGLNGAKDLTQSQLSLTERKLLIANGKNTMTPFKSILSAEEITLVAQYSQSLVTADE